MNAARPATESIHYRIEEWLNSATHGLGAVFSVIGTAALIVAAIFLLIAGGVVYTAGVIFYLADRIPYMDAV